MKLKDEVETGGCFDQKEKRDVEEALPATKKMPPKYRNQIQVQDRQID